MEKRLDQAPGPVPRRTPRPGVSPVATGIVGFLGGIALWHVLGFWAFVTAVVTGNAAGADGLLASVLLRKPSDQVRVAQDGDDDAGQRQRTAAVDDCATLTAQAGRPAVVSRGCPAGVGSVVSRRLAARADRLPMHIRRWATETRSDTKRDTETADAAETAAVNAGQTTAGAIRWAPVVRGTDKPVVTGSVR